MIEAGRLTHRLTIYKQVKGKSNRGAAIETLQKECLSWAELIESKTSILKSDDVTLSVIDYQFRIRWRENIEPNGWILYRSKWLKITGVNDSDPLQEQLTIDALYNAADTTRPLLESED